jgi:hypothetical protein
MSDVADDSEAYAVAIFMIEVFDPEAGGSMYL